MLAQEQPAQVVSVSHGMFGGFDVGKFMELVEMV
jgi:hypothetical protein